MDTTAGTERLGLRENLAQFSLPVLVHVFVGGMVGLDAGPVSTRLEAGANRCAVR